MILRVIIYFVMMFFFLVALGGGSQAAGLPPELGFAQWGPAIAGLLMLLIFRKDGHKMRFFSSDTPLSRYGMAVGIPAAAALIMYVISLIVPFEGGTTGVVLASPLLFALWVPFGALGEEIGWRGYLQPRLDTKLRGIVSVLIVGLLWTPIHVQSFPNGLGYMFFVLLLIISYATVIYALTADLGFNILLATIFHMGINYGNLLFLDIFNEMAFIIVNAIVWIMFAAAAVYLRRELFFAKPDEA